MRKKKRISRVAYVSRMVWDRALAMICDKNGNLEPAWIKIENNTVTEIEEKGKFISVSDIILDIETAKEGAVWEFSEPVSYFCGYGTRFRVLDIGHNYFEALGATAYIPGKGQKGSKNYVPPKPYIANIPCFIKDWGRREFFVVKEFWN